MKQSIPVFEFIGLKHGSAAKESAYTTKLNSRTRISFSFLSHLYRGMAKTSSTGGA